MYLIYFYTPQGNTSHSIIIPQRSKDSICVLQVSHNNAFKYLYVQNPTPAGTLHSPGLMRGLALGLTLKLIEVRRRHLKSCTSLRLILISVFIWCPQGRWTFPSINKRLQLVQLGHLVLTGLRNAFHVRKAHFTHPASIRSAVREQSCTGFLNKPIILLFRLL